MNFYDLLIIGGGPAGYRAAERAGHFSLKTALFEEHALGGVCLNEGCIPTKTLLYSAKIYDTHKTSAKYGVTFSGAEFDHAAAMKRKEKVVKTLVAGVAAQMRAGKIEVVNATARVVAQSAHGFIIEAAGQKYVGANLLICSGSEVVIPPFAGIDAALASGFAITSREALALNSLPQSLIVLGGGVVGMEMAAYFNSVGVQVSVVEMLPRIGGALDAEIADLLQAEYTKKGIKFYTHAQATRFLENGLEIERSAQTEILPKEILTAEKVLVAVGRKPRVCDFGLESLGVNLERGAMVTNLQMETNLPNLFAAGDVNGKSMLAHTAYREAEVAVNVIARRTQNKNDQGGQNSQSDQNAAEIDAMNYAAIPSVIYTNPEVATIGETLTSAQARGIVAHERKLPMRFSGRYLAENEGGNGVAKLVIDEHGKILGGAAIGNSSSEIISTLAVAIEQKMHCDELTRVIFPHPTVAEIFRELAFA